MPGAAEDILGTLEAFGLKWDREVVRQSRRTALYEAALERLRAAGYVYGCRRSRAADRRLGTRGPRGAIYPGTCRRLGLAPGAGIAERRSRPNRRSRFSTARWARSRSVATDIGDFVVKRRDGLFAYQLAVVVDDADGVTAVVRGADSCTPRLILLQHALGYPSPRYLHSRSSQCGGRNLEVTGAEAVDRSQASALWPRPQFLGQPPVEPGQRRDAAQASRQFVTGYTGPRL